MKLASLKGGRDGRLVVVSRDLTRACPAADIAPTLQAALDNWAHCRPLLEATGYALEVGGVRGMFDFDPAECAAPLPRAYQWADGSAYVNHVALVRRARGAEMPESFWKEPLLYQGGSDMLLGPCDDIVAVSETHGVDFEAEIAVILGDTPMGADQAAAGEAIRLLTLVNDVSLRALIPDELAKGFGFFNGKPPSAFSPVAVTPDELGAAWDGARLHGPVLSHLNGAVFGRPDAGRDMIFGFPELIAHAAWTRPLTAGAIIGSGAISNRGEDGGPGRPVTEGGAGYSCIAEMRVVETIAGGRPVTPFLRFGDRVRIEMTGADGVSIFGAIDQKLTPRPD